MLQLPSVTLVALTGKDFDAHDKAIQKSCERIEWGAVKVIYDYKLKSIDSWNYAVIYDLPRYIDTDFALLIHADGFPTRPDLWRDSFLSFDYIGAPWPLPQDSYSYRDEAGDIQRVGNSVGIRSKRLMDLVATRPEEYFWSFKEKYGNTNEDGFICVHNRKWLEGQGIQFAPLSEAIHFSKEHEIEENKGLETFAFHTVDL